MYVVNIKLYNKKNNNELDCWFNISIEKDMASHQSAHSTSND